MIELTQAPRVLPTEDDRFAAANAMRDLCADMVDQNKDAFVCIATDGAPDLFIGDDEGSYMGIGLNVDMCDRLIAELQAARTILGEAQQ